MLKSLSSAIARIATLAGFIPGFKAPKIPNLPDFGPDPCPIGRTPTPTTYGGLTGLARYKVSRPFGRRGRRRPMRVRMGKTSIVGRLRAARGPWIGTPKGGEIERDIAARMTEARNDANPFGVPVRPSRFGPMAGIINS
jgi:hypothetical protein